ncbi:MAG: N-acetylglutaminylglutamine synthetase [Gammaproteobacteria bacterium]|nr:N-acetylglutaminylglutamine synthetase [Gammaproteobacteria bacterium]MCP5425124.1 N-acetylglutaminylglutamine synthetase [Gammaproteobacteria bacterium]MCP5459811.1 N-acetylglutaminylglutamine synthetase [Gammaproteobacteria bacterium]
MKKNTSIYCGWGRIIMGHTFTDAAALATELCRERRGNRDIAFYVDHPHVVLSYAPQQLFLDPSDTLRLDLEDLADDDEGEIAVRPVATENDAYAINELYLKRGMMPTDPNYVWQMRDADALIYLVVEDPADGHIVGTVMGIDHVRLFDDSSEGSSLWCLAVDPQAHSPGIGEALVKALARLFKNRRRAYMDLSVMHHNEQAKSLYDKLGFTQIKTFAIKNKNAFNEALFVGPDLEGSLNPYAKIIVDEARARGIDVDVLDADEGYFRLTSGGKSVVCRESLSELTNAVAMSRCQDKYVTNRWLSQAGLKTPAFQLAGSPESNRAFLEEHGSLVVKPTNSEQGKGITVGVTDSETLETAVVKAQRFSDRVLLESFQPGQDLRIVVINYKVVAAAVRKPAQFVGDGQNDARTLLEKQSRRRQAATGGESHIPIDAETERCLAEQGYTLDSIVEKGVIVQVRKTANLHTGGTIHDVTDILHPTLVAAAVKAARTLEIPVVGLDFMVRTPDQPQHVIIEANERVGLANHEPQPTAQRFIDLLFPLSVSASWTETA